MSSRGIKKLLSKLFTSKEYDFHADDFIKTRNNDPKTEAINFARTDPETTAKIVRHWLAEE